MTRECCARRDQLVGLHAVRAECHRLNTRLRECLDFAQPLEVYTQQAIIHPLHLGLETAHDILSFSITPVPFPGALLLFGAGLTGLAAFGRLRGRIKA